MYAPFFGLSQEPFSIAPDPRFLFLSDQHREALAHLLYGLEGGGGFVLLTGEIGAGKTTVCRAFIEQLPAHVDLAYIVNPKLTVIELLQTICGEFGIAPPADGHSMKAHVDALNTFLLGKHAEGRRAVLVIDEAQSLSADVLEQLRLLTNLETAERKLLQIVLIGQPELRDMLSRSGLEQLAQRVVARFHLGALSAEETGQYIRHRLSVAGPGKGLPFSEPALARIHRLTGGVPRRINLLADRALLGAYAQGKAQADKGMVDQAAAEVGGRRAGSGGSAGVTWGGSRYSLPMLCGGALLLGLALGLLVMNGLRPPDAQPARAPDAVASESPPSAVATPASVAAGTADAPAAPESDASTASTASAASDVDTDIQSLLAAAPRSQATAWRELALHWNVAVGEGDPCTAVAQAGLACFSDNDGGIALVRLLARPGIVTLRGPTGAAGHVVLVGLDGEQATLQVGNTRHRLSLPALARLWRGDFSTLWLQAPGSGAGNRSPDRAADRDAERRWLSQQLAQAGFGAEQPLRERIASFQIVQGLSPDGVAGPLTVMRLNRATGVAEPRLAGLADSTAGSRPEPGAR